MLVFLTSPAPAFAEGEHSRRAAAELQVIIGDVGKLAKLRSSGQTTPIEAGLVQRINGGLSALDILFRLADQETGMLPKSYKKVFHAALDSLRLNKLSELQSELQKLQKRFPLNIPSFTVSDRNLAVALAHHTSMCAACHDTPATGIERPAYNLYDQAAKEPENEFFARMHIGVRGDRITGIDNPFSDIELVSLMALYKKEKPTNGQ